MIACLIKGCTWTAEKDEHHTRSSVHIGTEHSKQDLLVEIVDCHEAILELLELAEEHITKGQMLQVLAKTGMIQQIVADKIEVIDDGT